MQYASILRNQLAFDHADHRHLKTIQKLKKSTSALINVFTGLVEILIFLSPGIHAGRQIYQIIWGEYDFLKKSKHQKNPNRSMREFII